jgi:molecular chaperone IbpA
MNYNILKNDPFFVGFERLFDRLETANRLEVSATKYPPYNIIKTGENSYLIEIAVAGFDEDDFDIETHNGILTVRGNVSGIDEDATFIYKGIAARSFERKFNIADTVIVENVSLHQGMLTIRLVNDIPEEKKPRKITITRSEPQFLTEE